MKSISILFLCCLVITGKCNENSGGGSSIPTQHDQISEFDQMNRWYRYQQDKAELIKQKVLSIDDSTVGQVQFDFPLHYTGDAAGYYGISNFVDLNLATPDQLQDFNCGNRTYDLASGYNHGGIDFFTWPFPWFKMDNDEVQVIAAEPGVITTKIDGNDDRSCGFDGGEWNAVYVTHADGSYSWYGHMKEGSLTSKPVGASVVAGEYLGVVGSSGNSTGPHLHLETYNHLNQIIEPFFGACNGTTNVSWWQNQLPYYDSKINQLITHSAEPNLVDCPGQGATTGELTGEKQFFSAGDLVYFAAYYQDQLSSQTSSYQVLRPNGSVFQSWQHNGSAPHYAASYWWWSYFLPNDANTNGRWIFRVTFEGQAVDQYFWVGDLIFANSCD